MDRKDSNEAMTTVIVGAGMMGVSTAYYLSQRVPASSITIIDRHPFPAPAAAVESSPFGASHDINKIVRSDYSLPFYMDLAEEAISAWQDWDLINPFYHRTGWVALDDKGSDLVERIRKNFKASRHEDATEDIDLETVRERWEGILKDFDASDTGVAYWNPRAGWAEADKAVGAILGQSIERGVRYKQGRGTDLVLDEQGHSLRGVRLESGETVQADRIILATGAWTSRIMHSTEDKLGLPKKQRVDSQARAAGVCCAFFELTKDEKAKFDKMPVVIYGNKCDVQPPPPSSLLKFTNAGTFFNQTEVASITRLSLPSEQSQYCVPEKLKEETLAIINQLIPSITKNGRQVALWRLCWDLVTPEQHQLISKHPNPKLGNLFFAVGGSFHSWKFLPIIGKYVTNVVLGQSNGMEKDRNWSWKDAGFGETSSKGAHEKVVPRRDLKDF